MPLGLNRLTTPPLWRCQIDGPPSRAPKQSGNNCEVVITIDWYVGIRHVDALVEGATNQAAQVLPERKTTHFRVHWTRIALTLLQ